MPPQRKGGNATPANNPLGPRTQLRCSLMKSKNTSTTADDGPERFAPWYYLLQKLRNNTWDQQHNNSSTKENDSHQTELMEAAILGSFSLFPNAAPKAFVNQLVPPSEYPAVQLRNGVLNLQMSREPNNLRWLQARLKYARDVSDWSPSRWETYKMRSKFGTTGEATRHEMMSLFKMFPDRPEYVRTFFQRFDDFPEYAPFAQGIEKPCPGFVQGYRAQAYKAISIDFLCAAVCFNKARYSLTLPHIAGEFVAKDMEAEEAANARHGAALVYMRSTALGHAGKRDAKNMAVIMSFVTNGLSIQFYAHYASTSPSGTVEYHQYPISKANLMGSYDEFLEGVVMLRNCQDNALFGATHLKDILEEFHAKNGVNAWGHYLNDGEHILSEAEDAKIEEGGGGDKKAEFENQDTGPRGDDNRKTDGAGNGPNPNVIAKGSEEGTNDEDDLSPPISRQAQQTRALRPRRRVAQIEKKARPSPRKRQAGEDTGGEPLRKRSKRCLV